MSTLTDRYVHATTRSVPEDRRADLGRELRAAIGDMVEARVEAGEDPAAAERAVLTDMGDPARLAGRYTDATLHLIGPRYFLTWKRLLVVLLSWIPALVAGVVAVVQVLQDGNDVGDVVGTAVGAGIQAAFQVVFWTTLVFAFLERVDVGSDLAEWTLEDLPEGAEDRQISFSDTVAGVVVLGLLAVALVGQSFRSWVEGDDGADVAVLDPALWSFWLPFLLLSIVASIALELAKYRSGRWTYPLATINVVVGLWFAVPVAWLAARERLLNPEFTEALGLAGETPSRIALVIVVVAAAIVVFETVEGFWGAHKAGRSEPAAEFEQAGTVR